MRPLPWHAVRKHPWIMRIYFVFITILLMSIPGLAKEKYNFSCVSQIVEGEERIMLSLSGCVNGEKTGFKACKGQSELYLGTPYLTLTKAYFRRGRIVVPPVREILLIPAMYAQVSFEAATDRLTIGIQSERFGRVYVTSPTVDRPGMEKRSLVVQTRTMTYDLPNVGCHFL